MKNKIIYFIANIDTDIKNGATRHFWDVHNAYRKINTNIVSFTRKTGKFGVYIDDGLKRIGIPNFKYLKLFGTFFTLFFYELILLYYIIFLEKPQKIGLFYLRQTPLIFCIVLIRLAFKIPFIMEVNSLTEEDLKENKRNFLIALIFYILDRLNYRFCSHIIVVTEQMKWYLIRHYRISPDKISVIPNGFLFDENFNDVLSGNLDSTGSDYGNKKISTYILLYYGNLHEREGIQYLIKASSILAVKKPIRVIIIGEGRDENKFKNLVKNLNIESIVDFYGPLSKAESANFFHEAHICFAPLIRHRNEITGVSPIKIFEYLANKKVVISSRISGLEFIELNKIGILVNPEDVNDLVEKTFYTINNYKNLREFGIRGFEYVRQHHNWDNLVLDIFKLVNKYSLS